MTNMAETSPLVESKYSDGNELCLLHYYKKGDSIINHFLSNYRYILLTPAYFNRGVRQIRSKYRHKKFEANVTGKNDQKPVREFYLISGNNVILECADPFNKKGFRIALISESSKGLEKCTKEHELPFDKTKVMTLSGKPLK